MFPWVTRLTPTEITYSIGDVSMTYSGSAMPRWRRLWDTLGGGWAFGRIYRREAMRLYFEYGQEPTAREIADRVTAFFQRMHAEWCRQKATQEAPLASEGAPNT